LQNKRFRVLAGYAERRRAPRPPPAAGRIARELRQGLISAFHVIPLYFPQTQVLKSTGFSLPSGRRDLPRGKAFGKAFTERHACTASVFQGVKHAAPQCRQRF
jgi:hypothetical protein